MKKLTKALTGAFLASVMCLGSATAAFAASKSGSTSVDENSSTDQLQQTIEYTKDESEVVPAYTVTIPETVTLSKTAVTLKYTMDLQDDTSFVPDGKKISIKIQSAGYGNNLDTLAVWDSHNLQKAEYLIYNSDSYKNPTNYTIGDEIASWTGSNHGTITRRIKLSDYNSVGAGSYSGVINYSISLEDK